MISGAESGDRVVVVDRWSGQPQTDGYQVENGCRWDYALGNTGVVDHVWHPHGAVYIYVRPDPPNATEHVFTCLPRDLGRASPRRRGRGRK